MTSPLCRRKSLKVKRSRVTSSMAGSSRSARYPFFPEKAGEGRCPCPAQSSERSKARLCPETRQGALPPWTPSKGRAFAIHPFGAVGREGGGVSGSVPDRHWPVAARNRSRRPSRPTAPSEGFQGLRPWRESRGQRPLVGLQGQSPWPFPFTRLPCFAAALGRGCAAPVPGRRTRRTAAPARPVPDDACVVGGRPLPA